MILEIVEPLERDEHTKDTVFLRPTLSYLYDMYDLVLLMESCGFSNVFICNFGGYENAIGIFPPDFNRPAERMPHFREPTCLDMKARTEIIGSIV